MPRPTTEEIHYHATMIMGLKHDPVSGAYYTIWGPYAAPELVGLWKVVPVEDVLKNMGFMSRQMAQYGCD